MSSTTTTATAASASATATYSPSSITGHGPGSLGYIQFNLNVALIVLSTVFVSLRVYVRGFMVKAFGIDDAITIIAWALATVLSSLEIYEVAHGVGKHIQDVDPAELLRFFSMLPTLQLLYFISTGVVRLAIVAFLPRLNKEKIYLRLVYATAALITTVTLVCFFVMLTECKHIPDLWVPGSTNCMSKTDEAYMMWTHAGVGIFVDLVLMALPIWVIHSHMKFSVKTVQVILVFCVGMFAAITGVIRLSIIVTTDFSVDTTFKMISVSPWTDVEVHLGLWVGCFPALQPVIRILSYKLGLRSRLDSTKERSKYGGPSGYAGGTSGNQTNKLSSKGAAASVSTWRNARNGYTRSDSPLSHSKDGGDSSGHAIVSARGGESTRDFELDDLEKGRIRMKTEVQVRVHAADELSSADKQPKSWAGV